MNPSPRTHIYRLLIALVIMGVVFIGIRALAIPESWDSKRWYRGDALKDLQQLPLRFGGNESCQDSACHEPTQRHPARIKALAGGKHRVLSCEVCHGPLSDHVRDGKKLGKARIMPTNELCMNCHQQLISRPQQFAQFSETLIYHKLLGVRETTICRGCHDPHEPIK
jgi:hypothetical protein